MDLIKDLEIEIEEQISALQESQSEAQARSKDAAEDGDLSENQAYTTSKEVLMQLTHQRELLNLQMEDIKVLKDAMENLQVDYINLGSYITLISTTTGRKYSGYIVPDSLSKWIGIEMDNRISIEAPLIAEAIGKRSGTEIRFNDLTWKVLINERKK